MITAAYFDKHLKKHEKMTVYSADNVSHIYRIRYNLMRQQNSYAVLCK